MFIIVLRIYSFWIPRNHNPLDAFSPFKHRNHDTTCWCLIAIRNDPRREKRNTAFPKYTNHLKHGFQWKMRPPDKSEKTTLQKSTDREPPTPDPRKRDLNENPSPEEFSWRKKRTFHAQTDFEHSICFFILCIPIVLCTAGSTIM